MTRDPITLVGDGIENPWNALTMRHAAAMFGSDCIFRDRSGLAAAWQETVGADEPLRLIARDDLVHGFAPVIAFDNLDHAASVYGFPLPPGPRPAVIVGNERRGVARDMQATAGSVVAIPLASRTLNSLNVAAAAAVALFYLSRGSGAKEHLSAEPHKRRPELLLIGGADHIELGSAIRSAGAFGWQRIFVEDRAAVWFGCDRVTRSEGRAAARRARNPIRLVSATSTDRYAFDEVCVITRARQGIPLHRAQLSRGHRQVVVIASESDIDPDREDWQRLGKAVTFVHLDLQSAEYVYHYRLIATIALAEIARQVGQRPRVTTRPPRPRRPTYDRAFSLHDRARGEIVFLDDLECY